MNMMNWVGTYRVVDLSAENTVIILCNHTGNPNQHPNPNGIKESPNTHVPVLRDHIDVVKILTIGLRRLSRERTL
jgi:hypothetical protein